MFFPDQSSVSTLSKLPDLDVSAPLEHSNPYDGIPVVIKCLKLHKLPDLDNSSPVSNPDMPHSPDDSIPVLIKRLKLDKLPDLDTSSPVSNPDMPHAPDDKLPTPIPNPDLLPVSYMEFQRKLNECGEWDVRYSNDVDDDHVEDEFEEGEEEGEHMIDTEELTTESGNKQMYDLLKKLISRFDKLLSSVVRFSFQQRQIRRESRQRTVSKGIKHAGRDEWVCHFVVKKGAAYVCLSTDRFNFLDISQYLAPGSSYSSFIRAYQVPESKSYFPYEWFTDISKLYYDTLQARECSAS